MCCLTINLTWTFFAWSNNEYWSENTNRLESPCNQPNLRFGQKMHFKIIARKNTLEDNKYQEHLPVIGPELRFHRPKISGGNSTHNFDMNIERNILINISLADIYTNQTTVIIHAVYLPHIQNRMCPELWELFLILQYTPLDISLYDGGVASAMKSMPSSSKIMSYPSTAKSDIIPPIQQQIPGTCSPNRSPNWIAHLTD